MTNPFIRKLHAFASLSATDLSAADDAALEEISANAETVEGQTELSWGNGAADDTILILEGYACRYRHRETGARQIITYLLAGDLCDPDLVILKHRDHAVGTLTTCRVVRIPHDAMLSLLARHPAVARALRIVKLVEEAIQRERIVSLGCRSAIERTAHLFCELLVRHRGTGLGQGDQFSMPLRQADLADTLGLSNVHVNRVIQELRRRKLVNLNGKALRILDLPRLTALGEFRPDYLRPGPHIG